MKALKSMNRFGFWARLWTGMTAILLASTGCIIVDNGGGGGGGYYNEAPYITDAYVECFWDPGYADYGWDFVSVVDDLDGAGDVRDVWVEVWDSSGYLEQWDLVYDGYEQWSNTIYEYYSAYLNCDYYPYYQFDFFAIDSYGDQDSVTFIP